MLLREHLGVDGFDLHLLLDVDSAHRTLSVRDFAEGFRIHVHFVPAARSPRVRPSQSNKEAGLPGESNKRPERKTDDAVCWANARLCVGAPQYWRD
jgi:hypothetical protein